MARESNEEDNLKAYHWFWYKGSNIPKMFEGLRVIHSYQFLDYKIHSFKELKFADLELMNGRLNKRLMHTPEHTQLLPRKCLVLIEHDKD
ncbi:hypothetical protein OSB04_014548 [Centaurea solstitialis]|uniref:Uncharacterized protein n=1 Tax=Centaurea solstitialis TaxID=347529 RepID=A0AA38T523_9ASTR|nr:hypothetical protein OSB04_014548 [Centaurea solstitialis]